MRLLLALWTVVLALVARAPGTNQAELARLVGLEPPGGLYRPLAGERKARGLLRASESETLKGYSRNDYLEEDAFWAAVDRARETARSLGQRIRGGDVVHDPKGGDCPAWCDLWPMCRVERS